jgi:hypothetical protein
MPDEYHVDDLDLPARLRRPAHRRPATAAGAIHRSPETAGQLIFGDCDSRREPWRDQRIQQMRQAFLDGRSTRLPAMAQPMNGRDARLSTAHASYRVGSSIFASSGWAAGHGSDLIMIPPELPRPPSPMHNAEQLCGTRLGRSLDGPCAVCLDARNTGDQVLFLQCGHVFHVACVRRWLACSSCCPECRARVSVDPAGGHGSGHRHHRPSSPTESALSVASAGAASRISARSDADVRSHLSRVSMASALSRGSSRPPSTSSVLAARLAREEERRAGVR